MLIGIIQSTIRPNPSGSTASVNPPETLTALAILFTCLMTSFLTTFLALHDKQWISRYLEDDGNSLEERCWSRQAKFDGLKKWHFYLVIQAPLALLQLSLVLFGSALSSYLWESLDTPAWVTTSFTILIVSLYISFMLSGTSFACPFRTPLSTPIHVLAKAISRRLCPKVRNLL